MASTSGGQIAAGLREWAQGSYPLEAASELLIRAHNGRLLSNACIEYDPDRDWYWFNAERVGAEVGYLSSGERRLMLIAASLANPDATVCLFDAVPGLDRHALALVLSAVAHASGHAVTWTPGSSS